MRQAIDKFFSSEAYAVVGVSRNKKKFGNTVFDAMQERDLTVYPVNAHIDTFEGVRCYHSISDLPDEVKSVAIIVPPEAAKSVIADCKSKGIKNVWFQPGSSTPETIAAAQSDGLNVVHGHCIVMFLEPVKSFHAFHRWVSKVVRTYPVAQHA